MKTPKHLGCQENVSSRTSPFQLPFFSIVAWIIYLCTALAAAAAVVVIIVLVLEQRKRKAIL